MSRSHDHSFHDHNGNLSRRPALNSSGKLWGILIISCAYMIAEIVGGLISHSLALLADAGHMAIDTASIALGLFAGWMAQKPPNNEKTFGYYRAEILAALVNGATLVAVSLGIFYEAFQRLNHPPEVQGQVLFVVAGGGLLVNLVALFLMRRGRKEGLNEQGVWLHLLTDALGSVAALAAGFFVWKLRWFAADPIISIIIGALILYGSWNLLSECVNVLLEGVPRGVDVAAIKGGIEALGGVANVHDLHIWTVTSGVHALSAHVRLDDEGSHEVVLQSVTLFLRERHQIGHVTLQVEPKTFVHDEVHACFR